MILHAVGGLCNRLRAILSYRAMQGGLLDVVWDTDTTVSGEPWPFLPLSGLRFVEGRWDVEDYAPAKGAPNRWERAYVELRLPDDVTRRIALIHGDYAAVHIRRTDHIPNVEAQGGAVAPLVDYLTFAVAAVDLPLFVATDNGETLAAFAAACRLAALCPIYSSNPAIPGTEAQGLNDPHRNSSLADALVDLYVCAGATHFKGTAMSSFTDTIETLRLLRA